jgi:hypothetical protein
LVTPAGVSALQTTLPLSPPGSALTAGQYVINK